MKHIKIFFILLFLSFSSAGFACWDDDYDDCYDDYYDDYDDWDDDDNNYWSDHWGDDMAGNADDYGYSYSEYDNLDDFFANASDDAINNFFDGLEHMGGYWEYGEHETDDEIEKDYVITGLDVIGRIPNGGNGDNNNSSNNNNNSSSPNNKNDDDDDYLPGGQTNNSSLTDAQQKVLGQQAVNKIISDLKNQKAQVKQVKMSGGEAVLAAVNTGLNTNGVITSCLNFMEKNAGNLALKFGKAIGGTGVLISGCQTFVGLMDGKVDTIDVLNAVAFAAGAAALIATGPVAGVLGVASCVVGLISTYYSSANILEIQLENGKTIYLINTNILT